MNVYSFRNDAAAPERFPPLRCADTSVPDEVERWVLGGARFPDLLPPYPVSVRVCPTYTAFVFQDAADEAEWLASLARNPPPTTYRITPVSQVLAGGPRAEKEKKGK